MNQNKDETVSQMLTFQIGGLYGMICRECDRIFREKAFPLEMDQIPVILKLYYRGRASQQEISTGLQRDKASVNRTVSFLQKKGLVKVIQDAADKRKTLVELTAAGKKLATQGDAILQEFDASFASVLTNEEKKQFTIIMRKLIGTITST